MGIWTSSYVGWHFYSFMCLMGGYVLTSVILSRVICGRVQVSGPPNMVWINSHYGQVYEIPLIVPKHAMRLTMCCYLPISNQFDHKQEAIFIVIRSAHWFLNSLAPNRCGNSFIFQNHLYFPVSCLITMVGENGWLATNNRQHSPWIDINPGH